MAAGFLCWRGRGVVPGAMHWQRVGLVACSAALACNGQTEAPTPVTTTPTSGDEVVEFDPTGKPPELSYIEAGPGTEGFSFDCDAGLEETCNATDDDCDGVIDEGCGYGGGSIQITIGWDTGSDIDLYVLDPLGDTLSFQRPTSPGGGRVDHSGRGDCEAAMANPQIENARWVNRSPPPGEYEVALRYWGECITGGGPTVVVVSVAVNRKVRGQFRYELVPNERATILRFRVQ